MARSIRAADQVSDTARQSPPAPGFDATAGVFRAQDKRPAPLADVDPAQLSPCQRALLVIDGTVTQFLAACMGEPVRVTRLAQFADVAAADAQWLDCSADAAVLRRTAMLSGGHGGQLYAWADSVILPDRLTAAMRAGLDSEPSGLGQILLDSGLEQRREALWFGRLLATEAEMPPAVRAFGNSTFLSRSYRVIAGGQPLMLITERFPLGSGSVFEDRYPL